MKKYALLTGATGLVGRYLLRDLLCKGHRLAVVARRSKAETPVQRVEAILQFWEEQLDTTLPRPVVLEGDVTEPDLGLSRSDQKWIESHCGRVLHNAAVLTFHGADREGEPWRTNLTGTRHTLALCERLGLGEFHYVSTAYVCGTRPDTVWENELDVGQSFRNDYEHSKFLAEKLVREASFIRDLTVYRPTVIAGDSQTGYTSTYHGLYAYLKLMSVICRNTQPGPDGVRFTPVKLQMTGDEPRNIVPVDWVSAVICRCFETPELHGRTYHLAPKEAITPRQIIESGYTYFNSRGVEFAGPGPKVAPPVSTLDQVAKENMTMYESYETTDPHFDTTNLHHYLPDLPCPKIDEPMLHLFWRYGEEDRWGKRRHPKPVIPFAVEDFLQEQLRRTALGESGQKARNGRTVLGLNVYGPGGGQWLVEFSDQRLVGVTPGLPHDPHLLASLSSIDFARLVEKYELLTADLLLRFAATPSREPAEFRMVLTPGFPPSTDADWLAGPTPENKSVAAASRVADRS